MDYYQKKGLLYLAISLTLLSGIYIYVIIIGKMKVTKKEIRITHQMIVSE